MDLLIIFIILLLICILFKLDNKKNKIKEFFIASIKDKQKIGTNEYEYGKQPKSTTRRNNNINYETCYSTETRNGNSTGRKGPNSVYCDQGIDGGELVPSNGLYNLDFTNYNIYYGKGIRGKPLTGQITLNNGNAYILNNEGIVQGETLTLAQSKTICDSLKKQCMGFILIIPYNDILTPKTIFISELESGFEDPDTYTKLLNSDTNSKNLVSYVKKDPDYIERSISDNIYNATFNKYKNFPTCNWKSANRCIFKDYIYDQDRNVCSNPSNNNQYYSLNDVNNYTNDQLSTWLRTKANKDIGNDKLTSDESNVREYINRCQEVDGFEFLSRVSLSDPYVPSMRPGDIKGRYVRITINNRNTDQNYLQLADVQVISNNKNIAVGKNSIASSNWPGSSPSKANDGNNDGNWNEGSVFMSNNDGTPQYWEVDLGDANQTIDRVIISNRTDSTPERLNNWLLSIYDGNRTLVWARIFVNHPNPRIIIDISSSNNDKNNNLIKDYENTLFNKFFKRISNTEFNPKDGSNRNCGEDCHKNICEGEKKKWIGNSTFFGCREYNPGEYAAELAERELQFKDSDLLNSSQKRLLLSWLPAKCKVKLLYKGSRDGMNNVEWHRKVDNKGANITILRNTFGHLIGGYTSLSWSSARNNDAWRIDNNSFLFSLDVNQRFLPNPNAPGGPVDVPQYGPTWGGGHDLMIFGWSHMGFNCYHRNSQYIYNGYELTRNINTYGWDRGMFNVNSIETYQVII